VLNTYAKVHCKPSTAEGYGQICEKHLYPALGERLLHDVSRSHIKRLVAVRLNAGLRKRTIHNILTPLKEAYHHTIDEQVVTMNPVAKLGRIVASRESGSAHIAPLTA
jgi:site-specific recombinase XerD